MFKNIFINYNKRQLILMQQEIEDYNKNLVKLSYRLGDSIRHNNVGLHYLKNTFSYKYRTNKDPTNMRDFEVLYNIVLNSDYKQCPSDSIIFHLRLNDWFSWPNSKVVSNDTNYEFIEKHIELLKKLDNIFILYGSTVRTNKEKTEDYVRNLKKKLEEYNPNVYILNSPNTDQDFKYCVTAKYYIPSVGGFSTLAAALNKNKVFWEISDQYYKYYRSPNEKRDILLFKEYQQKNTVFNE